MQMVGVDLLKEHPRNKEFFDDIEGERWQEFVESIRTSGIIVPLIVTQDYVVISGNQRLKAAKELDLKEVPCEVRTYEDKDGLTKEDWMLKDLIETNLRQRGIGNLNSMKLARCILELERIYGVKKGRPVNNNNGTKKHEAVSHLISGNSQKEIAQNIGLTERRMQQLKKLNELIPELQFLVEQGKLSSSAGEQLAYLEQEQQRELYETLGEAITELKRSEIESLRKQMEEYKKQHTEMQHQIMMLEKQKKEAEEIKRQLEKKIAEMKPEVVEKVPDDYIQLKNTLSVITEQAKQLTEKLKELEVQKEELEKKNQEYIESIKKLEELNKTLRKERDKFIEISHEYEKSYEEEKWGFELTHALSSLSQEVAGRIAAVEMLLEKRNPINEKNTQALLRRAIRTLEEGIKKLSKWEIKEDEVIEVEYTTYSGSNL
ncbi:chromosome partitioning protein, ParB family [Thermoanaerobacter thermohydrosulfuricus]|uniref:Chromosome partitioning protein, ParB family n=1 Tax=Thermoanaerobacter thermohydrosulfuricus TaxID=1516 RepID=A0A1G7HS92_THETY|nr:ParB N-terminal domain-containing protein [Thermoanaerobacter thermohydrosulfuricus]SDF02889.1 chromosome partitioning protein, ParB family [Thermoanaerobacter thermohydrosulfuricus]